MPARARLWPTLVRLAVLAAAVVAAYVIATRWDAWVGAAGPQSTDDAYLQSDLTPISVHVAGYVRAVPVADYQRVHAGDLLVQIEDADYRALLAQADAAVTSADAAASIISAQREEQGSNVQAAAAAIVSSQAAMSRDQREAMRQRALLATGLAGTAQKVEQADATARVTGASLAQSEAMLAAAQRQVSVIDAQLRQAQATVLAQKAARDLAAINLGYTRVSAPADGELGQRQVKPGQYVAPGTQVIALVPLPDVWVLANYKETQLTHLAVGQPARITVDTFPGVMLRGHVQSYAPASGSQFSLLPADNATGNFTKVVQRITVKIVIDDAAGLADRLRPGMSVVATVDTAGRP